MIWPDRMLCVYKKPCMIGHFPVGCHWHLQKVWIIVHILLGSFDFLSENSSYHLHKMYKPLELPPCRICDGEASGIHYGVNTCEACKVRVVSEMNMSTSLYSLVQGAYGYIKNSGFALIFHIKDERYYRLVRSQISPYLCYAVY